MATAVIMPRQGQSVESCVIGKWHKQIGDKVSTGDVLFTYETDKAVFDEEAKTDGIMLDIYYGEGDEVECLKTVCVIGSEGESPEEFGNRNAESGLKSDAVSSIVASTNLAGARGEESCDKPGDSEFRIPNSELPTPDDSEFRIPNSEFTAISPRARALAESTGAQISRAIPTGANGRIMERDIQKVIDDGYMVTRAVSEAPPGIAGTGIGGRITTYDIEAYQASASASLSLTRVSASTSDSDFEEVKLPNIRKVIAKTMHASLSEGAQLTLHSSFDATDMFEFRKIIKTGEDQKQAVNITVTDIIVYAVSRVLLSHKSMNAHFLGDKMALFSSAHIGLAVDTTRGLLVPTIFSADRLTLQQISVNIKVLSENCRQGSIDPDMLKGGTFTVSNLGGLGIEMFTPILNPPQTGLLGVCCVVERTREGKPYPAIGLSLTHDHRAVDGADAARFLRDVVRFLEKFSIHFALEEELI